MLKAKLKDSTAQSGHELNKLYWSAGIDTEKGVRSRPSMCYPPWDFCVVHVQKGKGAAYVYIPPNSPEQFEAWVDMVRVAGGVEYV